MPKQDDLSGMPQSEIRDQLITILEQDEKIAEAKKIRNRVLDDMMTQIKKTGKKSIVTEDMDGETIVIRVVSTSEKIVFSKPPKKKTKK